MSYISYCGYCGPYLLSRTWRELRLTELRPPQSTNYLAASALLNVQSSVAGMFGSCPSQLAQRGGKRESAVAEGKLNYATNSAR